MVVLLEMKPYNPQALLPELQKQRTVLIRSGNCSMVVFFAATKAGEVVTTFGLGLRSPEVFSAGVAMVFSGTIYGIYQGYFTHRV